LFIFNLPHVFLINSITITDWLEQLLNQVSTIRTLVLAPNSVYGGGIWTVTLMSPGFINLNQNQKQNNIPNTNRDLTVPFLAAKKASRPPEQFGLGTSAAALTVHVSLLGA
jgi:hypothetical protein